MRSTLAGPRVLLRRLREVMAEPINAQERLDKIVVLIAANVVAEVATPMSATPSVPATVQELPMVSATMAQTRHTAG